MIHIPTLLGYSAVLLASIALLMVAIRPPGRRFAWFSAPFAAGALGCMFLVDSAYLPEKAGLHFGAFFISLAFAFGWQAVRAFFDLPARWVSLIAPSTAWMIAAFLVFDPYGLEELNAAVRIGLVALYSGLPAWLLLQKADESLPSKRPLGVVFAVSALLAGIALPFATWLPQPLGAAQPQVWAVAVFNGQIVLEVLLASALMVSMSKERVSREFYEASIRDPLTTLYNRRFLDQRKDSWQRSDRHEARQRAIIYFDIDHFKQINDQHGHALGDDVIVIAARVAQKTVRKKDWVFRIGGEEFLCVLPDCSAPEALAAAERLRTGFQEAALMVNGQLIEATLSAGIAVGVARQTDFDELILEADRRLYMAKQQGRNRVVAQNLGGGSHRCYSS